MVMDDNIHQMSSPGCDHLRRIGCRHHHHHQRPHYHHCHHLLTYCALHNHYFHCHCHRHRQGSHIITPPPPFPPQNPESFVPFSVGNNSNVEAAEYKEAGDSAPRISQELEHLGPDEEEDDEPVFVLTDEWRDFFAKAEARRQLKKKQRKKGKK